MADGGHTKSVSSSQDFDVNTIPIVIILGIVSVTVGLMLRNDVGVSGPNARGSQGAYLRFQRLFEEIHKFFKSVSPDLFTTGPNPNISGTEASFNLEGEGTDVNLEDSTLNTGRGAGSSNYRSDGKELPEGISGTSNSMNVKAGAKFKGKGLTLNAGADAGIGVPQKKERK